MDIENFLLVPAEKTLGSVRHSLEKTMEPSRKVGDSLEKPANMSRFNSSEKPTDLDGNASEKAKVIEREP